MTVEPASSVDVVYVFLCMCAQHNAHCPSLCLVTRCYASVGTKVRPSTEIEMTKKETKWNERLSNAVV